MSEAFKILTVIGTRPQFIKAAAVSFFIRHNTTIREVLVDTGQHFEPGMSSGFLAELDLPRPDYVLGIHSMPLEHMCARMQEALEAVIRREGPQAVLVYGDTVSTLAGARAAAACGIPLGHVEAGMRAGEPGLPEEAIRVETDRLSTWLFCATASAWENLEKEGLTAAPGKTAVLCGDVQYDLFIRYCARWQKPEAALPPRYLLASFHRAANTDDPERTQRIYTALEAIAAETPVLLLGHHRHRDKGLAWENVQLLPPLPYLHTQWLLAHAEGVVTDSGGLQKEAFFHQKSCAVLRRDSEWRELITGGGYSVLCEPEAGAILEGLEQVRAGKADWGRGIFGDGKAAETITQQLLLIIDKP